MKNLLRNLLGILKWFLILSITGVLALRWVTPRTTPRLLMGSLREHNSWRLDWKPMDEFPPASILDILGREDPLFWTHDGFLRGDTLRDFERLRSGGKPVPGYRTLSQRVAGKLFTLESDTWPQKGLESWFTLLIEALWGKRRILEAYLNLSVTAGPAPSGVGAAAWGTPITGPSSGGTGAISADGLTEMSRKHVIFASSTPRAADTPARTDGNHPA